MKTTLKLRIKQKSPVRKANFTANQTGLSLYPKSAHSTIKSIVDTIKSRLSKMYKNLFCIFVKYAT